jgi:hypothetical protein
VAYKKGWNLPTKGCFMSLFSKRTKRAFRSLCKSVDRTCGLMLQRCRFFWGYICIFRTSFSGICCGLNWCYVSDVYKKGGAFTFRGSNSKPSMIYFFFFRNFGNCSLSDEASHHRRTHFSAALSWRPRDSFLIFCFNATDTNRTVDFELWKKFCHYVTLSNLTTPDN